MAGPASAAAAGAPPAALPDPHADKYLIGIAVTMAAVLELIDTSIVNVALPHMMGTLGATLDEISWVSVGYIIANVIVIPMSGWLANRFGRRRYLTASILLFVVASFLCGAATTLVGLVGWRIVQGLGGGALLSTAQSTLFEAFPPEERAIGQAMFGVGVMVGPTIGPTLGGFIVDNLAWPWIFYINVPLGLLAAAMTWTYVRDSRWRQASGAVDWLGIALLTVAVGSLQWMLERGERFDWFDSRFVTGLLLTSVVGWGLFVWHELRTPHPVVDLRVLRNRQLAAGVAFASVLGFALFGSVFVLPIFLQQLHGFTAQQTGLVILPGAIASAVTMAVMGRLAGRFPPKGAIVVGVALFLGTMWRLSSLTYDAGTADLFWPLIVRGVGLGLVFVPLTNLAMAELPLSRIPQGTGMYNLLRQLGGSMGIAIMATLLARFTRERQATLAAHLAVGAPAVVQRVEGLTAAMTARGASAEEARARALRVLDRQVAAQASVLAFSRIYAITGLVFVGALPLLLLMPRSSTRPLAGADAH